MEIIEFTKTRLELIDELINRDGSLCQYPGCSETLDLAAPEGPQEVTIDHWYPKHYGKTSGWTNDEIWDISNLRLMSKRCNAKKGERVPNEDGTLPARKLNTFRYRRQKRAGRPEMCTSCDNGHNLLIGEFCADCGSDAQRFPRWAKLKANECSHDITWCWACSIGLIERESSIAIAMRQADSDELGEFIIKE